MFRCTTQSFHQKLLAWHHAHGRHQLPWQIHSSPYHTWLSEIMLQQTQVTAVIPYFYRFIEKLPSIESLANASLDEVFALWSGLGYYARARNLWKCAQTLVRQYDGEFPRSVETLHQLPGIGRSTAGAILSQAFHQPAAILDGNVSRLLARLFGIDTPINTAATQKQLWTLAESLLPPAEKAAQYTQAMMDLGSLLCKRRNPLCTECPMRHHCIAQRNQLTANLPVKLPPKPKTPMRVDWHWIKNAKGEWLASVNQAAGIWHGLWLVPQNDNLPNIPKTLLYREWQAFEHTLTHRQLDIHLHVYTTHIQEPSTPWQWMSTEALSQKGIPKPLRVALGFIEKIS